MLQLDQVDLPEASIELRSQIRDFLAAHQSFLKHPNSDFTSGHNPEFSALLGEQGWIGITWPKAYGGGERSFFDRYVVTEELLSAGAPVSAHWIADRQSGPLLLRYGSEAQRQTYLPKIIRGEAFFSIGMSEPNSGSDLASVRTRADKEGDFWRINGTKLWSTDAHRNHYMVALVRTDPNTENRHGGFSQMLIDLKNDDVSVRPIRNISGSEDFNEVVFADTMIPADRIVGELGNGWTQVTSELSYERSGPERFLSAFRVLVELVRAAPERPSTALSAAIGRLASHLMTLRRMSISVAGMLEQNKDVAVEAALVKELGNNFEKWLPEVARLALSEPVCDAAHGARRSAFQNAYRDTMLLSPSFTLRGGTREILRGVIARGLGLR